MIDIARRKDEAALEKLLARDFFWERDFGGGYDELKSPLVNLSVALGLGGDTDQGWRLLAAFARTAPGPTSSTGCTSAARAGRSSSSA